MSLLIFILAVITGISFIIFVISIIFIIVERNNSRKRNNWIAIGVLFFLISLGTFIYNIKIITDLLMDKTEVLARGTVDFLGEHLAARHSESDFLDYLKKIQPKEAVIPSPYFYCAGFKNLKRMPLIYPYSIESNDSLISGNIRDESNIKNIFGETNRSKEVIENVSYFYVNSTVLVTASVSDGISNDTLFRVLNFKSKEITKYENRAELKSCIQNMGINHPIEMTSIRDYWNKFKNEKEM